MNKQIFTVVTAAVAAGIASVVFAQNASFQTLRQGRYLVDAADCVSCHTDENGTPFAGGRPIETPFGIIYSPNITPDRETGIGAWSDDDFYRAMHLGVGPDGKRLYPAFPYPYFTKMTREDVRAIRNYLNTLAPVTKRRPDAELVWPLTHRVFLRGWDWMFFREGTFAPDPQKSADWNRGAYLVEGAAHCGACHTPKNVLGGDKQSEPLQGGQIQNWFAPQIANDQRTGLGSWSAEEIAEYLKTGRNSYSGATGLMAEVVANSTSKLDDADLHAIAVYVKDVASKAAVASTKPDDSAMTAGSAIFGDSCAGCHQTKGDGVPHMFPPLAHNANVQSEDPTSVIRVIIEGARTVPTDARPTPASMPAFDWKLDDSEISAVATYVRNAWGNAASPVTPDQVSSLRSKLRSRTN